MHYSSVNHAIIGSGKGLSFIQHQAIVPTNADLTVNWAQGQTSGTTEMKHQSKIANLSKFLLIILLLFFIDI